MEETQTELYSWDMVLLLRGINTSICGWALISVTHWYTSQILFKCWKRNIFL